MKAKDKNTAPTAPSTTSASAPAQQRRRRRKASGEIPAGPSATSPVGPAGGVVGTHFADKVVITLPSGVKITYKGVLEVVVIGVAVYALVAYAGPAISSFLQSIKLPI